MRKCSKCGGQDDLHVVTLQHAPGPGAAGRVLVYCWECRAKTVQIGVSIPIDLVTDAVFAWLYLTKRTASAPDVAAELVFGVPRRDLADQVSGFVSRRD